MSGWAWVHLFAAASGLLVAALAIARGGSSRLTLPLALLAADQFAFNLASLGGELTQNERFAWVGALTSPLFPALAFHFVATFLGRRESLRWWVVAAYVVFGAQAGLALIGLTSNGRWFSLQDLAMTLLATSLPVAAGAFTLVIRHYREAGSGDERWRTSVLLVALAAVVSLLVTDPLADLGLPVPRLATIGSFAFNVVLTVLTLRLGLFKGIGDRLTAFAQAVLIAIFIAVAYLGVFMNFSEREGVLIATMTGLTFALAIGGWVVVKGSLTVQSGLERFATLGRFSVQMAHDLKNPLAAARGAAEFLAEEMRRSGQTQNHEFSMLIVQQLDRLGAVIDRYQRLSKLEPELRDVELNELVRRVLSLQAFATANQVKVVTHFNEGPLRLRVDADLLASALENLVKNAWEAMPDGGTLTVSTRHQDGVAVVSIADTGEGMDARALEQAFDLFFTTKATGSGLGLGFVQQVARAHGGDVRLSSREGSGTLVELLFPIREKSTANG